MTSRNSLDLFATPDEQVEWLRATMNHAANWIIVDQLHNGKVFQIRPAEISTELMFKTSLAMRFFLGRSDISDPKWRQGVKGRELSFTESLAVLFEPSEMRAGALVAGRLSIMKRKDYLDVGLDPRPLEKWYRELLSRLRVNAAPNTRLMIREPNGSRSPVVGKSIVTKGVVSLAAKGLPLRQFAESSLTFEVESG